MNSIDHSFDYNSQEFKTPFFHNNLLEQNTFFNNEKPTSYTEGVIPKEDDGKKVKKKPGRKRKRENDKKSEHNKFSDDNLRRKVKSLTLKYTFYFINKKIKDVYNGNIGEGISKKELKTINQKQVSNATIDFNKKFLGKTIKEIFSVEITKKFTIFNKDYNKSLIENLMNEEDENKRIYFTKLFNLTFLDCLKQFRGEKNYEELEGFALFDNTKEIKCEYLEKYKEDGEEYIKELRNYIKNYENIINKKNGQKKKKT